MKEIKEDIYGRRGDGDFCIMPLGGSRVKEFRRLQEMKHFLAFKSR